MIDLTDSKIRQYERMIRQEIVSLGLDCLHLIQADQADKLPMIDSKAFKSRYGNVLGRVEKIKGLVNMLERVAEK